MNFVRLLALPLLGLLGAHLAAAPASEPPPAVFRVLTLVPADDLLMDGPRGVTRPIVASSNRFSPPLPLPTDRKIEFYRLVPAPAPKEPPRREIALRATVSQAPGAEPLLILLPREGPPDPAVLRGPLRALEIDVSAAAHPLGQLRVFNFSTREAALHLGATISRIAPGRSVLVPLPEGASPWLSTAILGTEGWQRISGGPLTLRPGYRMTLFMVDSPAAKNHDTAPGVSIFRVMDRPTPPAAP